MRLITLFLLASAVWGQMVTLPAPVSMPSTALASSIGLGGVCTIDASGEKAAFMLRVPQTGTISHVALESGVVTSSQSVNVTLQTVSTSDGNPTGTLYGSSAAGTIASLTGQTWYEVALGTPATATAGDLVAVVVEFTGTVGNLQIYGGYGNANFGASYRSCYTSSWAKGLEQSFTGLRYSDGLPYPPMPGRQVGHASATTAYNSGSASNVYGNSFAIAAPVRVSQLWASINAGTGASVKLQLRNSAGTLIVESEAYDLDQVSGASFVLTQPITPTVLPAGTYLVTMEPQSATSVTPIWWYHYSANYLNQALGPSWIQTSRTSGGVWSTTTNRIMLMGIVVDAVWAGSGGFAITQ